MKRTLIGLLLILIAACTRTRDKSAAKIAMRKVMFDLPART
jgi:hypothetical protein